MTETAEKVVGNGVAVDILPAPTRGAMSNDEMTIEDEVPEEELSEDELSDEDVPDELFDELKAFPPGAVQLEVGLQTFDDDVAAAIDRRTDFDFWRGLGIRLGQEEHWPWETLEAQVTRY